jgi:predicted TIM-barrel fold metal-dependent hydrolase
MYPRIPMPIHDPANGEFSPPPPTRNQLRVAETILDLASRHARRQHMSRRKFLQTASGLATAFLAMNTVYGEFFTVGAAEASDVPTGEERAAKLAQNPILDSQLHFVHDRYDFSPLLGLRKYAAEKWNPDLRGEEQTLAKFHFRNFLKEVFLESDTTVGLLSGAPSDQTANWFLSNDGIMEARNIVNELAGSRRMLGHFVFTPGQPGWIDEIDRAISELKPDSWKGYTVGDPLAPSKYPFRLDDEKLMYPVYEKMVKAGIRNVCIHKGLVGGGPGDHPHFAYAKVDDLPQAAKDWPEINFVIYHSALRPLADYPEAHLAKFEKTGRIDWVSDLAEIPEKYGVENVYGEIGTAFASSCIAHPRHAAALLGILVRGLGEDRVVWGTDSVWYGSPQWQIEAFRRIEVPADMRKEYGFSELGGPDSKVKTKIAAENSARLHGMPDLVASPPRDRLTEYKAGWAKGGEERDLVAKEFLDAADDRRRSSIPGSKG